MVRLWENPIGLLATHATGISKYGDASYSVPDNVGVASGPHAMRRSRATGVCATSSLHALELSPRRIPS
eukprot:6212754-Prymnesium_polylepis.1